MLDYSEAEDYLKAIGEETRLQIIAYLLIDPLCVCELVEFLQMSQPSISQHVRRLREAKIILESKRGKWTYYSLNKNHKQYPLLLHLLTILPSPIDVNNRIICN